jgi:hypothetical protein
MQYRLRTLLIALALGPMVLAGAWCGWNLYLQMRQDTQVIDRNLSP